MRGLIYWFRQLCEHARLFFMESGDFIVKTHRCDRHDTPQEASKQCAGVADGVSMAAITFAGALPIRRLLTASERNLANSLHVAD
jgi:hypothetical protein